MAILKGRCEEFGWELIREAEKVGEFKEMVDRMEKRLDDEERTMPSSDPDIMKMRDLRRIEVLERRDHIDENEAKLMDMLVKILQVCGGEVVE